MFWAVFVGCLFVILCVGIWLGYGAGYNEAERHSHITVNVLRAQLDILRQHSCEEIVVTEDAQIRVPREDPQMTAGRELQAQIQIAVDEAKLQILEHGVTIIPPTWYDKPMQEVAAQDHATALHFQPGNNGGRDAYRHPLMSVTEVDQRIDDERQRRSERTAKIRAEALFEAEQWVSPALRLELMPQGGEEAVEAFIQTCAAAAIDKLIENIRVSGEKTIPENPA
jgi:hypothetical protein